MNLSALLVVLAVALFVLGGAFVVVRGFVRVAEGKSFVPHSTSASVSSSARDGAINVCESAVTDQLTSPATAHFHDVAVSKDGDGLGVAGQVDSENGFGALLTSLFVCHTDPDGTEVEGTPELMER